MKRRIHLFLLLSIVAGLALNAQASVAPHDDNDDNHSSYEVWAIDQSNNKDEDGNGTLDSGGTLYVYQGADISRGYSAAAAPPGMFVG